jgi:hypothetical protein
MHITYNNAEQPDDGQHQWPKHVVVVIYVIKYLTHSCQLCSTYIHIIFTTVWCDYPEAKDYVALFNLQPFCPQAFGDKVVDFEGDSGV